MTKRITTETTLNVCLSNQEIIDIAKSLKMIPENWDTFSVEVKGNGISQGANITFQKTATSTDLDNNLQT